MSRLTTLTAVRAHIKKHNDSPNIKQFASLIDNGKNAPLKCVPKVKERFGTTEADFPQLGKKPSPFATLKQQPTAEKLCDMLRKEVKRAGNDGDTVFVPPPFEGDEDIDSSGEDAAAELIDNLANPTYTAKGLVPSLLCPALDKLTEKTKEKCEGSMSETPIACSVFPNDTLIPLQHHNETTSFSTLLIGSILWVIWPPTKQNFALLHQAYNDFTIQFDEEKLDIVEKLIGGVAFVQSPGEGLRIPPYCIMLGLATQTSVLAKYSILSATQFMSMLRKLSFLETWWKTEVNGDEKRADFGRELLPRIQRILAGEFDPYPPAQFLLARQKSGVLFELVHGWDKLKEGIARLVDKETAEGIKRAWAEFLSGVVGRNCALCGRYLQSKMKDTAGHFNDAHWPGEKSDRRKVASVDGVEVNGTTVVPGRVSGQGLRKKR